VIEIGLRLLHQRLGLRYTLLRGIVSGNGVVIRLPGLVEQLLRLNALLLQIDRAFVRRFGSGHGRPGAHDFDLAGRDRGFRVQERGLVRRFLEIDQALSLADSVALDEVDLLDLADDVGADVDLDLGLDLSRSGDDRLDIARRHRLDVDLLPFRPAAPNAEEDDDADEDQSPDDDESFLHLFGTHRLDRGPDQLQQNYHDPEADDDPCGLGLRQA
jgi:hypothetical protein